MGSMVFQLPPDVPADVEAELENACVGGGQEGMPFPTHVSVQPGLLSVERTVHESGFLMVPWNLDGLGRLMLASATLMERANPYDLLLELSRGKIHQLRNQTSEWVSGGLVLSGDIQKEISGATHSFGKAAAQGASSANGDGARSALLQGHRAARRLVETYIEQVFQVRHLRQPRLDTQWSCLVNTTPDGEDESLLRSTFNSISVPVSWRDLQPTEDTFAWDDLDRRVAWAKERFTSSAGKTIVGPLVDFSGRGLPDWLWSREAGLHDLSERINHFATSVVRRYEGTVRTWRLSAASNWSGVLASNDEEMIWLTVRLLEACRKIDPHLQLIVGLSQPWGEYLACEEHNVTPFGFVDTLLRTGIRLDALELELIMGVSPRGSYCRDALDLSRLTDLYVLLGVPLYVRLGYPSAGDVDPNADKDQKPGGGAWAGGYTPEAQADWANVFANLALCKPYIQGVTWTHWDDRADHIFPHCGLIDAAGQAKPALAALKGLRDKHLG